MLFWRPTRRREASWRSAALYLDGMIFIGEQSLRTAVREYLSHYHLERNHQGLGNKILQPEPDLANATGSIEYRERLGGPVEYGPIYVKGSPSWPKAASSQLQCTRPR